MRGSRRVALLVLGAVMLLAGCGAKSQAQMAQQALDTGLQQHQAGDLAKAEGSYRDCLRYDSMNKFCLFNLGVIAQTQQRAEEAQNFYRLALVSDAAFTPALYNLAVLLAPTSPQESIALYRLLLQAKPDDVAGHLNLGDLLRTQGDEAGAIEQYTIVQQLNSSALPPDRLASPAP
jgi:protein O-GlcNAc transferase